MKHKQRPMGRIEQVVTSIVFIALFLYLIVLVAVPLLMRMGLIN